LKLGAILRNDGSTLVPRCGLTETPAERARGLLSHASLPEGEGLWFPRHSSVHTFFMKFPIDVAFVDRHGRVIALYHSLKPWRHTWIHPFALGGGIIEASGGLFAKARLQLEEELRVCPIF
jgi:uncharacterized membrane protein (UPF0127 family)